MKKSTQVNKKNAGSLLFKKRETPNANHLKTDTENGKTDKNKGKSFVFFF